MSRKSACALKARDAAFAQAWNAALKTRPAFARQGNEVKEVEVARDSLRQADKTNRPAPSTSSSGVPVFAPASEDAMRRDIFFAALRETSKHHSSPRERLGKHWPSPDRVARSPSRP
jgi:hypothetical protein